ncbi:hypothetical protein PV327_002403 [Microctonus hyperodae]|uniref:Salivary secreted peptide n=1 Tax=Microctonus hyperodae TaxID=165561 RepID=A0AA39KP29_MICHY|nr:hypothetical protein PV327_002403 [Microctonus hyperodae]
MTSKFVFLAVILATFAIASSLYPPSAYVQQYVAAPNKSHHLIAGSRLPGDRLLLQQYIVKSSSWMQITTVEKSFNVSRYEKITQIQALDQKNDGTGAYPSIIRGGPGTSNVTIKFKSQRSKGINFVVLIYAR